jgi:hypothetical protein
VRPATAAKQKPDQEDFAWYLDIEEVTGIGHTFVIGHRPTGETEAGTWIGNGQGNL